MIVNGKLYVIGLYFFLYIINLVMLRHPDNKRDACILSVFKSLIYFIFVLHVDNAHAINADATVFVLLYYFINFFFGAIEGQVKIFDSHVMNIEALHHLYRLRNIKVYKCPICYTNRKIL